MRREIQPSHWLPVMWRIYQFTLADMLDVNDDTAIRRALAHDDIGQHFLAALDRYEPGIGPVECVLDYLEDPEAFRATTIGNALHRIERSYGKDSG